MSSFTCITCHVVFANPEFQRDHYKSDWHRYNLKRKIAELPPITYEMFQLKVNSVLKDAIQQTNEESYCEVCRKYFSSKNAFDNHLNSKKHRVRITTKNQSEEKNSRNNSTEQSKDPTSAKRVTESVQTQFPLADSSLHIEHSDNEPQSEDDDSDWESFDEDDDVITEINNCIFCSHESSDLEGNIKHMTICHSFFVPDSEYVVDLPRLISYLYGTVTVGHICLWCRKEFRCAKSTQQHMLDMGHCKILRERQHLEYTDFYDYTSSYPDDVENLGSTENEVTVDELNGDGWELTLPSGAKIGHRSLSLYYRQSLPPVKRENSKRLVHKMMSQYRAIGWTGKMSATALQKQKAKHISHMQKRQTKRRLKLGVCANKLQQHFRPQVLF